MIDNITGFIKCYYVIRVNNNINDEYNDHYYNILILILFNHEDEK